MARIKAGIINVTGYVGADLARILARHPQVELTSVTGRSESGKKLADVFPHLAAIDLTIQAELGDVDVAFSALPHKASAEVIAPLVNKGMKVIDCSADFRLKDPTEYQTWYEHVHPAPEMLAKAVYGLPELHKEQIRGATLVANPGCYPTSAILALTPALLAGLTDGHVVVDSKSGVSGAGRTLKLESHYCEADENVSAYSLNGHRHLPEIVQELSAASGKKVSLTFIPHLMPMTRGMLSSCYVRLKNTDSVTEKTLTKLRETYREFYRHAPFVHVVDSPPKTKQTMGSNNCLVHPTIDLRTGTLVVISCIDNLVKGAAGQAVQNMNIMFGLPETAGIDMLPLYP